MLPGLPLLPRNSPPASLDLLVSFLSALLLVSPCSSPSVGAALNTLCDHGSFIKSLCTAPIWEISTFPVSQTLIVDVISRIPTSRYPQHDNLVTWRPSISRLRPKHHHFQVAGSHLGSQRILENLEEAHLLSVPRQSSEADRPGGVWVWRRYLLIPTPEAG
jgi:hypothetical protein